MGIFSTTHIHQSNTKTEYVPYCKEVVVHEHKAPTDVSISLLNEMRQEARKSIIATIPIEENYLKAIAIYYADEHIENRVVFHIKFELNGKEYCFHKYIDKFDWKNAQQKSYLGLGNKEIFDFVHQKISELIATNLMRLCPDFLNSQSDND